MVTESSLCLINYAPRYNSASHNLDTRWKPVSRPGRLTFEERAADIHWIEGWMGPRAYLDDMKKKQFFPPGIEPRFLGRQFYSLPVKPNEFVVYYTKSQIRYELSSKLYCSIFTCKFNAST
jgi:hypothetical protein